MIPARCDRAADSQRRSAFAVRRHRHLPLRPDPEGPVRPPRRVMDAGCGDGRNLVYFLRHGFTCFGATAIRRGCPRQVDGGGACAGLPAREFPDRRARSSSVGRSRHGRGDLQRRPAFRRPIVALRPHAPGDVAAGRSGGLFFARLASTSGWRPRGPEAGRRVRLPTDPSALW